MEQQIIATWAQVGVRVGQLALITWGLRQMSKASEDRNRQLDLMETRQKAQSQALDRQGQVLGQIGQALERQGRALEELLRRSAG